MAQRKTSKARGSGGPIRLSDFLTELKGAEPAPVYVLVGDDPYLLGQARDAITRCVFADEDPGLGMEEFDGLDASPGEVFDALRTPPLLASRFLVFVRQADAYRRQPSTAFVSRARSGLEAYLAAPSPTAVLCLEVGSWNPSTKLGKLVAEKGRAVRCEADRPDRLPNWLVGEAKGQYGKELTYAAAFSLVEYLGPNIGDLVAALDRLDLYTGEAEAIDEPDVDAVVARGHHDRIWDLCDALAGRKVGRAMALLDGFWAEGVGGPQIVGLLRSELRALVKVKAYLRSMSLDRAMREAGVPRPAMTRVRGAAQAFSEDHLADAFQAMVEADLALKTTSGQDRLAIETLIHRLCNPVLARAARARP